MAFLGVIKHVLKINIILSYYLLRPADQVFNESLLQNVEYIDHGHIFESLILNAVDQFQVINDRVSKIGSIQFFLGGEPLLSHMQG